MFRLFLPTIIRELRSFTKVILVIYVYDGRVTLVKLRSSLMMVGRNNRNMSENYE